jgi:hypothetical protein
VSRSDTRKCVRQAIRASPPRQNNSSGGFAPCPKRFSLIVLRRARERVRLARGCRPLKSPHGEEMLPPRLIERICERFTDALCHSPCCPLVPPRGWIALRLRVLHTHADAQRPDRAVWRFLSLHCNPHPGFAMKVATFVKPASARPTFLAPGGLSLHLVDFPCNVETALTGPCNARFARNEPDDSAMDQLGLQGN